MSKLTQSELDTIYHNNMNMAERNCIYLVQAGSVSHGTNLSNADDDIRGVFVADMERFVSLFKDSSISLASRVEDVTYHELKRFMTLILKQNPMVLENLWVDEKFVIKQESVFEELRKNKKEFLTRNAEYSLVSYAKKEFLKLKEDKAITSKRQELLDNFGYDTKCASYVFRLLDYAKDIKSEGEFTVYAKNKDFLIDIRKGKYKYNEIIAMIEEKFIENDSIKNILPESPNYQLAEEIVTDIYKKQWKIIENNVKPKFSV